MANWKRASAVFFKEPFDQRALAFCNLGNCQCALEPRPSIDFWKGSTRSGMGRPFGLELVTNQKRRVAISFDRPHSQYLSAWKVKRAKLVKVAFGVNPVSSKNSRRAATSIFSAGSTRPFGIDHAPSSLRAQYGTDEWTADDRRDFDRPRGRGVCDPGIYNAKDRKRRHDRQSKDPRHP